MTMMNPAFYPGIALMAALKACDVPMDERRRSREQPYAFARQVAMWLLHDVCGWGSQMIGRLTRRDHGTVLHACQAVENRIKTERDAQDRIALARGLFARAIGKVKP